MHKILSIFGTRPEAIKMAPVVHELSKHPDRLQSVVCSTGQHRQMLDQVLALFDLKPDIDLNVMQPNHTLAGMTAALFTTLDQIITEIKPTGFSPRATPPPSWSPPWSPSTNASPSAT